MLIEPELLRTRQRLFQGAVIELVLDSVELPDGQLAEREVVLHNGGVVILPYLQDSVVLVEQYRHATGQVLLELPAGRLNKAEDPSLAARRELQEETGYTADTWQLLGEIYTAPGFCSEKLYIFWAAGLTQGIANPDPDEFVRTVQLPKAEFQQLIKAGRITDSKTLAAWSLAQAQGLV